MGLTANFTWWRGYMEVYLDMWRFLLLFLMIHISELEFGCDLPLLAVCSSPLWITIFVLINCKRTFLFAVTQVFFPLFLSLFAEKFKLWRHCYVFYFPFGPFLFLCFYRSPWIGCFFHPSSPCNCSPNVESMSFGKLLLITYMPRYPLIVIGDVCFVDWRFILKQVVDWACRN